MKHDDASWHHGGDFPTDLPKEAGSTHIAMFLAWAVLNGLGSDYHNVDMAKELTKLRAREVTPGAWFRCVCDEKFTDEDLSDEGNSFAASYYGGEAFGSYLEDYSDAFPSGSSLYHVEDAWTSFDALAPTIAERFRDWRGN